MTSRRPLDTAIVAALLTVFLVAFLRTAWVSDDAYITFRTIDNFLNGYGLRWNVVERVQSYTHPLWLIVLVPWHWATGEPYFSTLVVSVALSLMVVWRLASRGSSAMATMMVLVALLFSRAFLDYSTSGLENPLANLLLVAFFGLTLRDSPPLSRIGLLAGLLLLTRLDLAVIIGPAILVAILRTRTWRHAGLLAGLLPLVAWELFSVLYYGFPFPNTAYAKLKTGVPAPDLAAQGFIYLFDSLARDPVTLATILTALVVSVVRPSRTTWPVAAGVLAYLGYVVRVGGDFMSGRFLVAPLVVSAVLLVSMEWPFARRLRWAPAFLIVAALAVLAPDPMPQHAGETPRPDLVGESGIADERLVYFPTSGLAYYARGIPWPADTSAEVGRRARRDQVPALSFCCVGTMGFFAGPAVYVIDEVGLGDPLLARLPAETPWRIGHFQRTVPDGYLESVETGENRVREPGLAAYYERLRTVTRAPLFSGDRIRTLVRMNLGQYEPLLAQASSSSAH